MTKDVTTNNYINTERHLKDKGFKILYLIRDTRGDWGDDGGYIISVSKKDEDIYLHVLEINHNHEVSMHVLSDDDVFPNPEIHYDENADYFICGNLEYAKSLVQKLLSDIDIAYKAYMNEEWEYLLEWNFENKEGNLPQFSGYAQFYMHMLAVIFNVYHENPSEEWNHIDDMFKTPYTEPKSIVDPTEQPPLDVTDPDLGLLDWIDLPQPLNNQNQVLEKLAPMINDILMSTTEENLKTVANNLSLTLFKFGEHKFDEGYHAGLDDGIEQSTN